MATLRQSYKEMVAAIERVTSDYSISLTNNGHYKVTIRYRGHSRVVFHSGTPGDCRAIKNFARDVRREYQALRAGAVL